MKESNTGEKNSINCFLCEYFYITYERNFPYGCRIIGFKSRQLPSIDVYANSSMDCGLFSAKEKKEN
jgi:hypothetical protein